MCICIQPLRQKHFPQNSHVKITKSSKSKNSIRKQPNQIPKETPDQETIECFQTHPIKFQKTFSTQPITAAEIRNLPNKGKFDRCGQTCSDDLHSEVHSVQFKTQKKKQHFQRQEKFHKTQELV